ncbi:MAG: HEAT repeat domain-containing protein [Candidatus Sumerlaeaceae bacterium]
MEIKAFSYLVERILEKAGFLSRPYYEAAYSVTYRDARLPIKLSLPYYDCEEVQHISAVLKDLSQNSAFLSFKIADKTIAEKVSAVFARYSADDEGLAKWKADIETASDKYWAVRPAIDRILALDNQSVFKLESFGGTISSRAVHDLIELCDQTEPEYRKIVYQVFIAHHKLRVHRRDKEKLCRYLIKLFPQECRNPENAVNTVLCDHVVPTIAEDLERLIRNRCSANRNGGVIYALARTKHPRAAELIASVMDQPLSTVFALQALGVLRASKHSDDVRKYLNNPNSEVRREAKKALKQMGADLSEKPSPVHLTKRRTVPKKLDEWSENLDITELEPFLAGLSELVDNGFGSLEVAEVVSVVENQKLDQTRVFRFPVNVDGHDAELWISIFMDDTESPDVAVYGPADLIRSLLVCPRFWSR